MEDNDNTQRPKWDYKSWNNLDLMEKQEQHYYCWMDTYIFTPHHRGKSTSSAKFYLNFSQISKFNNFTTNLQ